jgi:hypothetical protein
MDSKFSSPRNVMKFTALPLALAIPAAVFLLSFPFYAGLDGSLTLIAANGFWVLIPILLPVAVASMPLAFHGPKMRILSSVLLGTFVLISGFTIGLCFLPAAVASVLVASRRRPIHQL